MPIWEKFPPSGEDVCRLKRLQVTQKLFDGKELQKRYSGATMLGKIIRQIGIVENFPKVISQVSRALLFGRKPTFTVGAAPVDPNPTDALTPPDTTKQQILDAILRANDFETLLKESAVSQSRDGGCVFRVRWGVPSLELDARVIIEEIPACNYFVQTTRHNKRDVTAQILAWRIPVSDDGSGFLCLEIHTPGKVQHMALSVGSIGPDGRQTINGEVPLTQVYSPDCLPPAEELHGYPGTLVEYVPNERDCAEYFGRDDYEGIDSVFEAINNRISKIDSYLDDHAEPKFVGLPGMMGPAGQVDPQSMGFIETAQTELAKYLPRYVTWDGQIGGSLQQLEHLIDTVCRVARMAPAFFGLDKAGSIESGIAMRMRFFSTTSKIDDKQGYYDPVVKRLLRAAMWLHGNKTGLDTSGEIDIFWRHGLPIDSTEETRLMVDRIAAETISRETAIGRMDGVSREDALREMARINGERASLDASAPQQPNQPATPQN
jgi:hypothetical protein